MRKRNCIEVLPSVPLVPVTQFSKLRLTNDQMRDAWSICGPSVAANINKSPLWIAITMAYLEGLCHGAGLMQEAIKRPAIEFELPTQLGDPIL